MERVGQMTAELAEWVAALDPDRLEPDEAAALVAGLTRLERVAAAGRLRCARRVADSSVWSTVGYRSPEEWLARTTGAPTGQAMAELATAERLERLPIARAAMCQGALSVGQVQEITKTAAVAPHAEGEMVGAAGRENLRDLQAKGRAVRAAVRADDAERHERIRRARYLRHWIDDDGAVRIDAKLVPEVGAEILARLRPFQQAHFDAARKAGAHEHPQAYAADALLHMARAAADGGEPKPAPVSKVIVRVDLEALRRGTTGEGEVCDIPGVGPVPVASARALLGDAFVAFVITSGVDVVHVSHLGRHIPAAVRTALEWQYPTCVEPGCGRLFTEIDHAEVDVAEGGPTALWNLKRRCSFHHDRKTHHRGPPATTAGA